MEFRCIMLHDDLQGDASWVCDQKEQLQLKSLEYIVPGGWISYFRKGTGVFIYQLFINMLCLATSMLLTDAKCISKIMSSSWAVTLRVNLAVG